MSLVLAVASRAHELFEKYGSIRAELGKACGEKFYPTLLVTARPVLGRRELLLRPGRRQRVTSKLGELGSVDDELGVGDPTSSTNSPSRSSIRNVESAFEMIFWRVPP